MPKSTLYEFFEVEPDASASEIRAAYLRLMKKHHPDRNGDFASDAGSGKQAASLNAAFAILRDPQRRAEYDAKYLELGDSGRYRRDSPKLVKPRTRSPRRWPVMTACAAMIVSAILLLDHASHTSASPFADVAGAVSTAAPPITIQPNAPESRAVIRTAIIASFDDATTFSRQCFADAANVDQPNATGRCVIFDEAFVLWNSKALDAGEAPAYFQLDLRRGRHLGALAASNNDREAVLRRLRSTALSALLTQIRDDMSASASKAASAPPQDAFIEPSPYVAQEAEYASHLTANQLDNATQGE
jgi:hypothetical protein